MYAPDGSALQQVQGVWGGAATHNRRSLSQAVTVAAGALRLVPFHVIQEEHCLLVALRQAMIRLTRSCYLSTN